MLRSKGDRIVGVSPFLACKRISADGRRSGKRDHFALFVLDDERIDAALCIVVGDDGFAIARPLTVNRNARLERQERVLKSGRAIGIGSTADLGQRHRDGTGNDRHRGSARHERVVLEDVRRLIGKARRHRPRCVRGGLRTVCARRARKGKVHRALRSRFSAAVLCKEGTARRVRAELEAEAAQ